MFGGWGSNHIWSFTQPTPSQKWLRNREPRYDSDVTDRRMWLFVEQHASHSPVPSDFESRHRDAKLTSPLELNYRILPEYGVITRYSRPTEKRSNRKNLNCGNSMPQNALHNIEARQQPEFPRPTFELKWKILCSNFLNHPKHHFMYFIATKLTHGHLLAFSCFYVGSSKFFLALWDWKEKNWHQQRRANTGYNLRIST